MISGIVRGRNTLSANALPRFQAHFRRACHQGHRGLQTLILACALVSAPWMGATPALALDASGTAKIQCGAFSGAPQSNPAWVRSVPYSIAGDQISFSTPSRQESDQWNGTVDGSGHLLLTGSGSGGGGAWVMHFTGKWHGVGNTRLVGGYHNVQGMVGHRTCSITF